MVNIPQNCRECENNNVCNNTYYGGTLCKHHDEINKLAIERFWAQFDKKEQKN